MKSANRVLTFIALTILLPLMVLEFEEKFKKPDMFDCKQVVFAQRQQTIVEGLPIQTKLESGELHESEEICTALHYYPPDDDGQRRVVALFDNKTIRTIFDIDEIMGYEE